MSDFRERAKIIFEQDPVHTNRPFSICCTGERLCPGLCAADFRVTADSTKLIHLDRRQVPANHCNFILERW